MEISAKEYLERSKGKILPLLDVRSETEYAKSYIPHSINRPILNDQERHLVGISYKKDGKDTAIKLGQSLVTPNKAARLNSWLDYVENHPEPLITCFRGGLRSRIATSWIEETGAQITRIRGGYKAIRQELLKILDEEILGCILTAPTGSNKTQFLYQFSEKNFIDLEALANHRGSAFGKLSNPQPEQANFENLLAMEFLQKKKNKILLEDESKLIGKINIPNNFYEKMKNLPRVYMDCSIEERSKNIFTNYVNTENKQMLFDSLRAIYKRLGGLHHDEIYKLMQSAFECDDKETHLKWIEKLLVHYYDPSYQHSFERYPRKIIFRGNREECLGFLKEKYFI